VVKGSSSFKKYLDDIAKTPILSRAEEMTLVPAAQAGDRNAFHKVIRANLRYVVTIANKYKDKGVPIMDIIGEGNIGLFRALESFDSTRGIRFITYTKWWIRQSITYALLYKSHVVRIPQSQLRKVRNARTEKDRQIRENPILAEHAHADSDVNMVSQLTGCLIHQRSLDHAYGEDKSNRLIDCIPNENSLLPDEYTNQASLTADLNDAFGILEEREVDVLKMMFGFQGDRATLGDVAIKYGISRERVRQIKNSALEKLRTSAAIKKALRQYLE